MLIVAVRVPSPEGSKVIWKLVLLPGITRVEGRAVTPKSAALVPLISTKGVPDRAKSNRPVFSMVKVLITVPLVTSVLPKFVPSVVSGVLSPETMRVLLPWMSMPT